MRRKRCERSQAAGAMAEKRGGRVLSAYVTKLDQAVLRFDAADASLARATTLASAGPNVACD